MYIGNLSLTAPLLPPLQCPLPAALLPHALLMSLHSPNPRRWVFFNYPVDRVLFAPQNAHCLLLPMLGMRLRGSQNPPCFFSDGEMEKFSEAAEIIPLHPKITWQALIDFAWICCMHRVFEGAFPTSAA